MKKNVLSVGQCGIDHPAIVRTLRTHFQADVIAADFAADATALLRSRPFDLVLVNRVLFQDGSSGLAFIDTLQSDPELRKIPVMLVSNYADAQRQAIERGALPGFGKAELRSDATIAKLRQVLVGPAASVAKDPA